MKKLFIICLVLMMSTSIFANDITITLDDKEIKGDVSPYIQNDRTLVPIRLISENLGYEVFWNETDRKVTIKDSKTTIELVIDSKDIFVNGTKSAMDTSPVIKSDRTFVPLRFVAQFMGLGVDWDANTYTVLLKTLTSAKESSYYTEIESLLTKLNNKTEEVKKYFYSDVSKYSHYEVEEKFNSLKQDIDIVISQINNMTVPQENQTSYKLITEATTIINSALNEYKSALLDANIEHAKKLVHLQTELALKVHEVSNALNAEKNGVVYVPDIDSQIFNRAGEISKYQNPLEDELIQNLIKQL